MGRMSGWRSLRRFALLAASILSSCFLLTEGQSTITPVKIVLQPPHPAIGQNVTLTPTTTPGDMENAVVCYWYRGLETLDNKLIFTYFFVPKPVQTDGPVFTGRETAGPGCSLHIRNLTSEDTGNYTVTVSVPGKNLKGQASLTVSEKLSSPVLWPSDVTVAENANVTLNCNTSNNSGVSVSWFKDGKPLLSGLSDRNRTLTLILVTRNDAGLYTCNASNPVSFAMSNSAKITVAYEGGGSNGGLSGGAIAGIVVGTLAGVILIAGLLYYICTKTSIGRMELHASNGNVPSAPGQNQGVTDTKPKAGEEDLQYSILAFKDTNRSPPRPTSEASQPSESGIIYSEIKKK